MSLELCVNNNDTDNTVPSVRQGHTQVLYNDHLYVYSGRTNGDRTTRTRAYADDMYKFDFKSQQWSLVDHKNVPLGRHNHSAIVYNDRMYVWGGSGSEGFYDDLLVFDFVSEMWSTVSITSKCSPQKRHGHSAVLSGDKMVIFGGHFTPDPTKRKRRQFFNDVWEFDLERSSWREIHCRGEQPIGRTWHNGVLNMGSDHQMIVFGGWWNDKYEHYLNDLYVFDLKKEEWIKLKANCNIPFERNRCSLVPLSADTMLLQGGNYFNTRTRESKWFNDAYRLELDLNEWEAKWIKLNVTNAIPLSNHTATLCHETNEIWIFGGEVNRKRYNYTVQVKF